MKYEEEVIKNIEEYEKLFSEISPEDIKKTLDHALDIRKFEIELYWKRATYYWTFIAFIFGGFFALSTAEDNKIPNKSELLFIISCIGFTFSIGWYLANRGSKFWQENWEKHVDMLENKIIGPLHKTVIENKNLKFWKFYDPYRFSVTKINQILSLYVSFIWFFLFLQSISTILKCTVPWNNFNLHIVLILTVLAISFYLGHPNPLSHNLTSGIILLSMIILRKNHSIKISFTSLSII